MPHYYPFRPFLLLVLLSWIPAVDAAEKPNILLIYTDDQSFDTIAALGHPIVKTPNLDRLVDQGTTFTNAYNQGAWHGAVCVASRMMLNSGRFLWNAHNIERQYAKKDPVDQEERKKIEKSFWAPTMKNGGYKTYFSGKWHNVVPPIKVFDRVDLVRGGMPPTVQSSYNRPLDDSDDVWSPFDPKFEGHWTGGRHWAEALASSATDLIGEAARSEEPFFMYLAFNSPHDPRQAPKEFVDMYPEREMDVPPNFLPEYPYRKEMGCPPGLRDERLAPFPRTERAVRVHRREYYAIISHMDAQIGRILDALDTSGKRDHTYIFFTADNGLAIGAHGLFGKQSMFEHSMKIPLIVLGPDIPKGKRIETPVHLQDIVPTSLELARIDKPDHVEFTTLMPLIRGEASRHDGTIYGGYMNLQRMVRKDDFKLILYPENKKILLFDLKNDPYEIVDLSNQPEYRPKVRELFRLLRQKQTEVNDSLDLSGFSVPSEQATAESVPFNTKNCSVNR